VEKALASVDKSIPTLVLSELVLAYLGQQGTDDLLSWCSFNLCTARGSAFAAYEVLGPSNNNNMDVRSEIEGYKYQYLKQFQDKLARGLVQLGEAGDDKEETFHPLGDSPGAVQKRLSSDQFEWSQTGLAGTVAACVFDKDKEMGGGRSFKPCEPFDEHAALTLHLHSYVFLCAFAKETDIDLIRVMCPWTRVSYFDMQPKVVRVDDDSEICFRPIEAKDQQQTIKLFLGTYKDLSTQVSSVSKMVNAALRTDLKCSVNEVHSSIDLRYKMWGGVFLVAVESGQVNDDSEESSRVIGCVGIRRCDASEGDVRGGIVNTFEIHRLAVDTSCRGRGVGKMLLRIVEEEFVRPELNGEAYRIIATTPSLLKQANPLYTSNGFRLVKQESIGEMAINTYVKTGNR
jgi:ribosomal protein S18 acetylase RimI-like enzyme